MALCFRFNIWDEDHVDRDRPLLICGRVGGRRGGHRAFGRQCGSPASLQPDPLRYSVSTAWTKAAAAGEAPWISAIGASANADQSAAILP